MPTFVYKAKNSKGDTIRNRVEMGSRRILVRLLKENDLTPIEVQQVAAKTGRRTKNKKRNVNDLQEIMQNVNTTSITRQETQKSPIQKIKK